MKTLLRIFIVIILAPILMVPSFHCCKKYEDGPFMSLKSRKERVSHSWQLSKYTINDIDSTAFYSGYSETFSKEGNYSYSTGTFSGTAIWSFHDKDSQIKLMGLENQGTRTITITKLDKDEFWYYYYEDDNTKEIKMKRK